MKPKKKKKNYKIKISTRLIANDLMCHKNESVVSSFDLFIKEDF